MGTVSLPATGLVYVDAQIAIYSADSHPRYAAACAPLWRPGRTVAVSSELTLLETLVAPLRSGNAQVASRREDLWRQSNTRLLPITREILREAARLRALHHALKTPDAIHAATALMHGCALFVTNDLGFRRIPGLPIVILDTVVDGS